MQIGVYFFFPETNGRHLEEVDMIFTHSKNIFDAVPIARKMPRGKVASQVDHGEEAGNGSLGSEKTASMGPVVQHQSHQEGTPRHGNF